jgi:erythromycin esterase-like protein/adenine/guanine phosphoribosyltransferase-like PRPP-binding protein
MRFTNRIDAGRQLASRLTAYAGRTDVIVLGLPRGGVPVAAEVARHLKAPLDVFLVRKLGVPGHTELAMGAISEGGVQVLDRALISHFGIRPEAVEAVAAAERTELARRQQLFRGLRPRPDLHGRTVIVVDDGLATGATMEAAVAAIRQQGPAAVVVAAPVGAPETCARLRAHATDVVCAAQPRHLDAVGLWYDDFTQTTDDEVRRLLEAEPEARSEGRRTSAPPATPAGTIARHIQPITGAAADYDRLLAAIGDERVVMIGEASHGTHEFYRERARITKRLIADHGFTAVAVEADWPDAYRVNRYVRGAPPDGDAVDALGDFERFPAWMWRNADVLDFVGWLRSHNEPLPTEQQAGFYGLDLYSLHASMRAVVAFLDKVDPPAAAHARMRYACFDRFGDQVQAYAHTAGLGLGPSCEREVLTQLLDLRRRAAEYAQKDGRLAPDEYFVAEQNARVVRGAEAYYRTMLAGRVESWNLRDRHMHDTLENLLRFLDRPGSGARVVVWAHNSHLGDARATEMGEHGELNLGQLVRESLGSRAVSIGFTTHAGTVTAAVEWDGPAYRRHVRPSIPDSVERLLHDVGEPRFWLACRAHRDVSALLEDSRLERAIGVLYRPETERQSHYFRARLAHQFDYIVHLDVTRAVEPLERTAAWSAGEYAETFPTGL